MSSSLQSATCFLIEYQQFLWFVILLVRHAIQKGVDMMMDKDRVREENPHQMYNNTYQPMEQTGEPMPGSKKVKQANHSRQVKTREG
jgi:hypothetical protein